MFGTNGFRSNTMKPVREEFLEHCLKVNEPLIPGSSEIVIQGPDKCSPGGRGSGCQKVFKPFLTLDLKKGGLCDACEKNIAPEDVVVVSGERGWSFEIKAE